MISPRDEAIAAAGRVFNQTPALVDYNLFETDDALQSALVREGASWAKDTLLEVGRELGRAENFERARLANRYPPILKSYDAQGRRVDQIEFHPAWHELLRGITARGFHTGPWAAPRAGAHVARAAGYLMQAQVECGTLCPTTMTYGSIAALHADPYMAKHWLPTLLTREHDARDVPIEQKCGAMIGMGMTEKQGGSDVRANTSVALLQPDGSYELFGHKWFFSAPQCDAHLVLAQTPDGLSCLFVPRFRPDGQKNGILIQRLKDKVGNRSNASAEVEFAAAYGRLLGESGHGIATILEMGTYTRLDCVLGTTGMLRQALVQALHHARYRQVFGRTLLEQPLMQNVLVDLVIESEAATALALRLARAFDAKDDPIEAAFRRVMTSASKFWICKRGPEFAAEAMEVLGGNGYVEESALARIYREMPVNSIWEGSGNIMCLDLLRALSKSPLAAEAVWAELTGAQGVHVDYDRALDATQAIFATGAPHEGQARRIAARLVLLVQAALLLKSGRHALADAFCKTRLAPGSLPVLGALPLGLDNRAILAGAWS